MITRADYDTWAADIDAKQVAEAQFREAVETVADSKMPDGWQYKSDGHHGTLYVRKRGRVYAISIRYTIARVADVPDKF